MRMLLTGLLSAVLALILYNVVRPAEAASTPVPKNAILYFNATACPAGWTVVTAARGRYIVGLQSGGSLAGVRGTAFTSDLESRPVGQHNHTNSQATTTASQGTHQHPNSTLNFASGITALGGPELGNVANSLPTTAASAGAITVTNGAITINNAGAVADTNAPYIQFLVCQKT